MAIDTAIHSTVLEITYGSQTFRNASNKVTTFVMVCDGTNKREFPNKILKSVKGSYASHLASQDGYEDHGTWYANSFYSEDSTVLCIQASTTLRGSAYNNGAMFIALREDASLIKVNVNLHPNRNAVYTTLPAFMGRGDILLPNDLTDYGVRLTTAYKRNYMEPEELDELFNTVVLKPGKSKPDMVSVESRNGEIKRVFIKPEQPRRVRIRRGKNSAISDKRKRVD